MALAPGGGHGTRRPTLALLEEWPEAGVEPRGDPQDRPCGLSSSWTQVPQDDLGPRYPRDGAA